MFKNKPITLEITINKPYHVRQSEVINAVLSALRDQLPKAFSREREGFHIGSQDIQLIQVKESGKWFSCPRCSMYKKIEEGQEAL